jgi:hypothetical protein
VKFAASVVLVALLVGCTPADGPEVQRIDVPTGPSAPLEVFGLVRLPDERLVAAIPKGFELDAIKRNPTEFRHKGWITVGVRLHPEEIHFARAIFYVLSTPAKARRMYLRQSRMTRGAYEFLKTREVLEGAQVPRPFEVRGAAGGVCGVRVEALYWCHARHGRLYLLTQSSTSRDGSREVVPGTKAHAGRLLKAFARLLGTT